jgi:hypothetical protein
VFFLLSAAHLFWSRSAGIADNAIFNGNVYSGLFMIIASLMAPPNMPLLLIFFVCHTPSFSSYFLTGTIFFLSFFLSFLLFLLAQHQQVFLTIGIGLCIGWAFGAAATRAAWAVRDQAALKAAQIAYVVAVFDLRGKSPTRHIHRLSQTPEFKQNPTLASINAIFEGKFLDTKYVVFFQLVYTSRSPLLSLVSCLSILLYTL